MACPDQTVGECSYGVVDKDHRWDADQCDNPGLTHIRGCQIKKGDPIDASILMHPKKYCPEGWGEPFADSCYLAISQEKSWGDARSFCKDNQSTSDLVTIFSPYENNHVKQISNQMEEKVWIGLSDTEVEGSWLWVDERSLGEWNSWASDEPNGGRYENCVELDASGWNDKVCSTLRPFVCKMAANEDPSGNPVVPETSTMPPTNNCGYNGNEWVENPDTGMCYSLVTDHQYTWQDAREHCKYLAGYREVGDLASIGSLEEQTFFNCNSDTDGHKFKPKV